MLDSVTKKNIDDCRDILVGKVPDPKSQIEQITLALIYKFMDNMDEKWLTNSRARRNFLPVNMQSTAGENCSTLL